MLKERFQEVFEFTKSESPYRKANKGWINQDIFLDLNPSYESVEKTKEAAKVTIFWSPINSLLSNIFLIVILGSILVFISLNFAKGRFDFNLFNEVVIQDNLTVDQNIIKLNNIDSIDEKLQKDIDSKDLDAMNSFDNDLINEDQIIKNDEIGKKEIFIKESERKIDIQNLQKKKQKSNFI